MFRHYYILPAKMEVKGYTYNRKYASYSDYNYLQSGIASNIKTWHFEQALRMTQEFFNRVDVIDFGCADGPFLPSLSKYFRHVIAIDKNPMHLKIAGQLVEAMHLNNVRLICNDDCGLGDLMSRLPPYKYHILYLLETLEHIGDKSAPWESRINFLSELFQLLDKDGIIVASVPNMVGIFFLLQRLGFSLLHVSNKEEISLTDLLRASLLNDTSNLERNWNGGHIGFNHKKLEKHLCKKIKIQEKRSRFQIVYKLRG